MKKQLYESMRTGETLNMIYRSRTNVFSKRRIKVLGMKKHSIVAYCFVRQAIRTFHMENILAIEKMEVYIK